MRESLVYRILHRGSRWFSRWFSRHIPIVRICRERIFHDIYVFTTYTTHSRHIVTIICSRHILTTYTSFTIHNHDIFSRWKTLHDVFHDIFRHSTPARRNSTMEKIPPFICRESHRGVVSWVYVVNICREYFTYMSWIVTCICRGNTYRGEYVVKITYRDEYVVKITCRDYITWSYFVIIYRDCLSWFYIVILHREYESWL